MVRVRVPRSAEIAVLIPKNRDKPAAGFNETPGEQSGLAERCHAIKFPQPQRLLAQVQGGPYFTRMDEREGPLPMPVHASSGRTLIQVTPGLVELFQERAALLQTVESHVGR